MSRRKEYPDDDGRSIADMSGVERPRLFSVPVRKKEQKDEEPDASAKPQWVNPASSMSKADRRAFIWGALGAALLIALAFIAGLGLVILLITLLK